MNTPSFEKTVSDNTKPVVFLCDHASNRVPDAVGDGSLGLPAAEMQRHIAFDIGARGVTLALCRILGGTAIMSTFSRLVIDPNRAEDDPTLIMQLYDGTIIPANRSIDDAERQRRLEAYYLPYHNEISRTLDGMDTPPILISVHSFTPQLSGRAPRPWHIGILSADDRRLAEPLLARLAREPDLCVGDNEPYVGKLEGDCMTRHGINRGLPHVLIEIRNDLIADPVGETEWAARLAPALWDMIAEFEKSGE